MVYLKKYLFKFIDKKSYLYIERYEQILNK